MTAPYLMLTFACPATLLDVLSESQPTPWLGMILDVRVATVTLPDYGRLALVRQQPCDRATQCLTHVCWGTPLGEDRQHIVLLPGCIVTSGEHSIQICCRANERQMSECLGKVPEVLPV